MEPDDEAAVRGLVDDPGATTEAVAGAAWRLFEANDFASARRAFARVIADGAGDADIVAALHALHLDAGDPEAAAAVVGGFLDGGGSDLPAAERVRWATILFDLRAEDSSVPVLRQSAGLRLLEAAAAAGGEDWRPVLDPARRRALDGSFVDPLLALEGLEQQTYAPPESGLPVAAIASAEELGHRHAERSEIARAAERFLHACGEPAAAYRVERSRRSARERAMRQETAVVLAEDGREADLRGLMVAIVGGHGALRSRIGRDLGRVGVAEVREIPSAREATRQGRDVLAALAGVDLVVLIVRQLSHSTSDQVRRAASRLGVAVVAAETASAAAVRRAVERHVEAGAGR